MVALQELISENLALTLFLSFTFDELLTTSSTIAAAASLIDPSAMISWYRGGGNSDVGRSTESDEVTDSFVTVEKDGKDPSTDAMDKTELNSLRLASGALIAEEAVQKEMRWNI